MSCVYEVDSACLRYVVPFRFKEPFDVALNRIEAQTFEKKKKEIHLWERKTATLDGTESDLYSYIRNELRFDDSGVKLADEKIGCEWLYWRSEEASSKDGQKIKELLYYPDGIKKKKDDNSECCEIADGWPIIISNVGVMLFRNGLGITWYELKIPQKGINSNQIKSFQNVIRELNRGTAAVVWEKQRVEPDFGIVLSETKGFKTYLSPFSFGNWVYNLNCFLDVSYLAERKNSFASMIKNSLKGLKGISNEIINKNIEVAENTHNLPDKAVIFSFISFGNRRQEETRRDKYELVFHVTNGYKDTYHFSDEVVKTIQQPFDDAYWYATQEGASYLVWPTDDNKVVFNTLLPAKIRSDYFTLYIKILYQSYSLLLYAERIQSEISAISGKFLMGPLDQRITDLFGEINLFLTKSMATSVSHIHHQSEFFVYLKRQLRIQEDVESVTSGLNALDVLQREQRQIEENKRIQKVWQEEQRRDKEAQEARLAREEREKRSDGKLQAIMGLFALLGISSALVDCFDLVGKFDPTGEFWGFVSGTQGIVFLLFVIIGIISIIAVYFSVKSIIDAFRGEKNRE